jgi:hypothetical protein
MAEEVTVVVTDANPPGDLINGVYVGLYDNTTKALLQFDTTGNGALPDGEVIFSAVVPDTYEIRIVPQIPADVLNGKIQTITVLDAPVPPESNIFDVALTQAGLDVATNPTLCRCSGYFVDMTGRAAPRVSIHLSDSCLPQIENQPSLQYDAKVIVPSKRIVITDEDGFVSVDLYRGERYAVYIEGWENVFREIIVPDVSAMNIADVLWPFVSTVEYYDGAAKISPVTAPSVSVAVDATKELTFKVLLRNTLEAAASEVTFELEDDTLAEVAISYSDKSISITGLQAGTTNLLVTRAAAVDDGIRVAPSPAVVADLEIVVT